MHPAPVMPRWSRAQIDLLKRTIAKGLTDDEMQLFVYVCRRTGLDPFLRQAYAIKRWDSEGGDYRMAIQTGIDGYRLQAARSESYAGSDPPEFEVDSESQPVLARVTVYKIVGGERCAFTGEARWSEYVQRTKEGEPTRMWRTSPYNQLAKCAEAQALRKGFPAEVQGLMIHEEMPAIEGSGEDTGTAAGFSPSTLYEGKVTVYRLPEPKKKRPGQIAIAVEEKGVLGPLGFWDIPEPLKEHEPEKVPGVHVQISYTEQTGKRGQTYKNLSHLAVKPPEAGGEEEPGQEAGGESPPAQGEESPAREKAAPDPAVEGARQPLGGEPPAEETPVQYWKRNILTAKNLSDLKVLWDNFAKKGGRFHDFTAAEQKALEAAKEKRKAELSRK